MKFGTNYYILKEIGELIPDVLTILIPVLKGSKITKGAGALNTGREIGEEAVEKTTKELGEEATEKTVKELSDAEAEQIAKEAREALENGTARETVEKAGKEAEEKVDDLIEEIKNPKRKQTPKEQKVFLKKLDLNVLLKQYADDALTKWKDPFTRPGAVAVLEGEINGKIFQAISYSPAGAFYDKNQIKNVKFFKIN